MRTSSGRLVLKIILAIVLPPAAAFWQVQLGVHFWVNLALTIVAWIPGIIHALWLVLSEGHTSLLNGRTRRP
jgi:uncharacterized membrane protein YqaE (UPF0057 family)